ncbi:hypothetical protein CPB85DRAFT_1249737 [Mucidula mucida]|nr:hypothetical protein CPB85DRAFT_1249737 [Mucidula mucida]
MLTTFFDEEMYAKKDTDSALGRRSSSNVLTTFFDEEMYADEDSAASDVERRSNTPQRFSMRRCISTKTQQVCAFVYSQNLQLNTLVASDVERRSDMLTTFFDEEMYTKKDLESDVARRANTLTTFFDEEMYTREANPDLPERRETQERSNMLTTFFDEEMYEKKDLA